MAPKEKATPGMDSQKEIRDIVVIGGGIAGLSGAYYAAQRAEEPLAITILESAGAWGGKIVTERIPVPGADQDYIVEGGPDTFVVTKPWAVNLCKALGIDERLRGTNPETKKTYILKQDRLHELPGGLTMFIPTEFGPMLRTGLLSWPSKARMGLDFLIPPAALNGDESVGAFVTRRLGRSAYENLIEPLMSGIYAGNGDKLSLKATFPYLRDLELKHGGLVKGVLAIKRERARKASRNGSAARPAPGSRSIFLTPLTGLAEIVEALVDNLRQNGVELRLDAPVSSVQPYEDNPGVWEIVLADGVSLLARSVILATPAYVSAALLSATAPELGRELAAIEYVSTATVTLAYPENALPQPLDGYGYTIPRKEGRRALACTWTSTKFPHRAPEGHVLLRVFIGRAGQEDELPWDDTGLLEVAQEELEKTMGITSQPSMVRIYRWKKAMPQYNAGHIERLERIEEHLQSQPGLALAGNGYRGIGIPDCIHSGEQAAQVLTEYLAQRGEPAVAFEVSTAA